MTRAITKTRRRCSERLQWLSAASQVHHRQDRPDHRLHPHDGCSAQHRARAADPGFQQIYRPHRPMVERSIAWLTRGNRRVRYRGVAKNNAWLHHRVAALNLRRLLALGLTFESGTWQLA